jgi:hypothetical protein
MLSELEKLFLMLEMYVDTFTSAINDNILRIGLSFVFPAIQPWL